MILTENGNEGSVNYSNGSEKRGKISNGTKGIGSNKIY
jgi:hypothetical protein